MIWAFQFSFYLKNSTLNLWSETGKNWASCSYTSSCRSTAHSLQNSWWELQWKSIALNYSWNSQSCCCTVQCQPAHYPKRGWQRNSYFNNELCCSTLRYFCAFTNSMLHDNHLLANLTSSGIIFHYLIHFSIQASIFCYVKCDLTLHHYMSLLGDDYVCRLLVGKYGKYWQKGQPISTLHWMMYQLLASPLGRSLPLLLKQNKLLHRRLRGPSLLLKKLNRIRGVLWSEHRWVQKS